MAERTAADVAGDLVTLACAGIQTEVTRDETEKRVRELADEGYRLVREDERLKARKSVAGTWSGWLDWMIATGLLEEVLGLEPGTRARLAVFTGERPGG